MRKVSNDVDDSFYYNCGLIFGHKLGYKPDEIKHRYIGEFKRFVDAAGGQEYFRSAEEATNKFFARKRNSYAKW